jgi:hypothetical protein
VASANAIKEVWQKSKEPSVHVRYMSSEVEPCVVWALRALLPFLAKLIED